MKHSNISRLKYLLKARHHGGHGIHSPFLFHLITTIIENKQYFPEYGLIKNLRINTLQLLSKIPDQIFSNGSHQFHLTTEKQRSLFLYSLELHSGYDRLMYRLVHEFKPKKIVHYGPTLGINSAVMALANREASVFQVTDNPDFNKFSAGLLRNSDISNVDFLQKESGSMDHPDFILINYPNCTESSRYFLKKTEENHAENAILILRGIHQSNEMENLWQEVKTSSAVRVTLDLFQIGLVLFRVGLQKENFIYRF